MDDTIEPKGARSCSTDSGTADTPDMTYSFDCPASRCNSYSTTSKRTSSCIRISDKSTKNSATSGGTPSINTTSNRATASAVINADKAIVISTGTKCSSANQNGYRSDPRTISLDSIKQYNTITLSELICIISELAGTNSDCMTTMGVQRPRCRQSFIHLFNELKCKTSGSIYACKYS
jgi:hypothetical protein